MEKIVRRLSASSLVAGFCGVASAPCAIFWLGRAEREGLLRKVTLGEVDVTGAIALGLLCRKVACPKQPVPYCRFRSNVESARGTMSSAAADGPREGSHLHSPSEWERTALRPGLKPAEIVQKYRVNVTGELCGC